MSTPTTSVLYPGSFDPMHLGHVDIVEQAVELFGSVVVAAMHNREKPSGLFSITERVSLIEAGLDHLPHISVVPYSGLAIDAAREFDVDFIIKGLRNASDFDIEQQMAHMNHSVAGVRTVYLPCRPDQVFLSSRFIREIAQYRGDVSHLVPAPVADALARRFATPPHDPGPLGTAEAAS